MTDPNNTEAVHGVDLSFREIDCLKLAAEGMLPREIAQSLSMTEDSVLFHLLSAETKLNANNLFHAVVMAIKRDLI